MNIKKLIASSLAVVAVTSFVSCSTDLSSTEEESRTVMSVDGWEVPYEMYRYAAMMYLRDEATSISTNAENESGVITAVSDTETVVSQSEAETSSIAEDTDSAEVISSVIADLTEEEKAILAAEVEAYSTETIVNIYSLFTAAKEADIDPFGEMINSLTDMEMEEIRATYDSDSEYLDTIKLFFMNDSVYSILTRYEIVFNQLYEKYVNTGKIDNSDDAVIEYMKSDDAVRVKQILISFERHSEEEALQIAKEVSDKLSAHISAEGIVNESEFDSLTDKYGEDLFMFKNRDGYYLSKGYTDKDFEEASFALELGHVSDIVRTSAGYSIIMRAEKDSDFIEENVSTLKEDCLAGIYRSMLDEYAEKADVQKNDDFSKIDIFTMK